MSKQPLSETESCHHPPEDELQISQAYLTALMESTNDWIVSWDCEMRVATFNNAYRDFVRQLFHIELCVGMLFDRSMPPEWIAGFVDAFDQVLHEHAFCRTFTCEAGRDMQVFEVTFSPVLREGVVVAVLAFGRDVTIQLHRNRELAMLNRASQALTSTLDQDQILRIVLEEVRNLLNVFASSLWLLDEETGELVCRQATGPQSELVLGWRLKRDQGIAGWVARTGESVLVYDTQEDTRHFAGVAKRIDRDLRSILTVPLHSRYKVIGVLQVVDEGVGRFTKADQALLEPLGAAAAIAIENARLVEGLESKVATRTAEIRAERDKSEAILRSAGDGIAMMDPSLLIHYVNPVFERLTGYTVDSAMGQGLERFLSDEVSEQTRHTIRRVHLNGLGWQGEVSVKSKNGLTLPVILTTSPIRDAQGTLQGYVMSLQDISRIKELERARQQFITNVSHQLRTPVTTLKLQSYLMQQLNLSDTARHYLDLMEKQISLLVRLIEDIIEMTVLDSGTAVRAWEPILIADMLTSIEGRFRSQAESAGLELVMSPSPLERWVVNGDVGRLVQACGKILDNAVKFTPSGGKVIIAVNVVEEKAQSWLTLSICDNGPGIPAEEQPRVFERFFQGSLAESGHVPGTGLGLSFAHEVVRAHAGRITLSSQEDAGAEFTIWLPLASQNGGSDPG
ncbi:MAG: PAS domain-containing protein [Anaerolineae bacterium]|nr:PAS domain-containing protein [Anaerolineae bacterium]